MNLLLDENLPLDFRHYLPGHDVRTAQYMGWKGRVYGELLVLAQDDFDVLITLDQSMEFEQNITEEDVAVIVLRAGSNDSAVLRTLVPEILATLYTVRRGEVRYIPPRE